VAASDFDPVTRSRARLSGAGLTNSNAKNAVNFSSVVDPYLELANFADDWEQNYAG
jgi:hypothetical protein